MNVNNKKLVDEISHYVKENSFEQLKKKHKSIKKKFEN